MIECKHFCLCTFNFVGFNCEDFLCYFIMSSNNNNNTKNNNDSDSEWILRFLDSSRLTLPVSSGLFWLSSGHILILLILSVQLMNCQQALKR